MRAVAAALLLVGAGLAAWGLWRAGRAVAAGRREDRYQRAVERVHELEDGMRTILVAVRGPLTDHAAGAPAEVVVALQDAYTVAEVSLRPEKRSIR